MDEILEPLQQLLGSPLYSVRRLTAKAISNLVSVNFINEFLIRHTFGKCVSENLLHGMLLLLINYEKCHNVKLEENQLDIMEKIISLKKGYSFLNCLYLERLKFVDEPSPVTVKDTLLRLKVNEYVPGIFLWANTRITYCLKNATWEIVPEILKLLKNCKVELSIEIITDRVVTEDVPEEILTKMAQILLTFDKKCTSYHIWKTLYYISLKCSLHKYIDCTIFEMYLQLKNDNIHRIRYLIPLAARVLVQNVDNRRLAIISEYIFKFCNPDNCNIDMRHISAIANNQVAHEFSKLTDNIKINAIKSAVILLQDEDVDVRDTAVHFYNNLTKHLFQPYVCLNKIMTNTFMNSVFNNPDSVQTICRDLLQITKCMKTDSTDSYNPFANDKRNIYIEVDLFEQLVKSVINNKL